MVIAVLAAIAIAAVVAYAGGREPVPSPAAGAAPAIRLPDLTDPDRRVELAHYRGRPVVVNFFASWCKPCREELPLLREASERLGDRVAFLGVAHLDDRELAAAMLEKYSIDYPAGHDPDGSVARRYRLRGLPSTAFVGPDGELVGVAPGQLDRAELDRWLAKLVAA